MKDFSEKVLVWGTCALVFFLPFVYFSNLHLAFVSSKTFLLYGFTEIVFCIWLYKLSIDASYRFSKKEFFYFIPLLLFVFWLTLSAILGTDLESSFWSSLGRGTGLITLFHTTALTFVIASLIKKYALETYGYKVLAWFLGGAFLLLLSVWFGNEGFQLPVAILEKSKGGGFMGNSSLAATILVFAFFFGWFLIFSSKIKQKSKILLGVLVALIVFSPLFVNLFRASVSARGALVGICFGVVAFFLVLLMCNEKKILRVIGGAIFALAFLGAIFVSVGLFKSYDLIHEKFTNPVLESRLIFWGSAQKAMSAHPFFGFGSENFRVAQQKYFDPRIYSVSTVAETWSDRAHNIVFDTGVSGGYPAIVFYLVLLGSIITASFRAYRLEKISRNQFGILIALVIAYVIQNLFVFDSNVSLVCFGLLIALSFGSLCSRNSEEQSISKVKHRNVTTVILFVLFIIMFLFFTILPFAKAMKIKNIMNLSLNKRFDQYSELLKGSSIGDAFDVGVIAENIYQTYESNLQSLKNDPKLLPYAIRDLESYTAYLEAVTEKDPEDLRLRFNLARLYVVYLDLAGKKKDSLFVQKILLLEDKNIEASPNDPEHYWLKAITLAKIGQKEEARIVAQEAFELAPYIDFSQDLLSSLK